MRPKEVEEIVRRRAFDELSVAKKTRTRVSRGLVRLLSHEGDVVAWRAAEGLGKWLPRVAEKDLEFALKFLRQLSWSLQDECGATPWMSAEAVGEIGACDPELVEPFINCVIAHYHDVAPRGALWVAGRTGGRRPKWFKHFLPDAFSALDSPDPLLRGLAVWALGQMHTEGAEARVRKLAADESVFLMYRDGEMRETRVSEMVREACVLLEQWTM